MVYGVIYHGFTDLSGPGLTEQPRILTHVDPPKNNEDFAEHVDMRQDKMRRLEPQGGEFKLAPAFKINALRMRMTGQATTYFEIWETVRGTIDASKS